MKHGRIYQDNATTPILDHVMLTTNPFERMRGLLGRTPLTATQGMLIRPCSSIHTIGMRYPIDIIFLNADWVICKLVENLGHFNFALCKGASTVLETRANAISRYNLATGNRLRWEEN